MKINTAIIGYGISGTVFHGPLLKSNSAFQVTHIVSSRTEQIKKDFPNAKISAPCLKSAIDEKILASEILPKEALPVQILDDPQVNLVVITTPNTTHFPFAWQALEAGKNVILEKPFVINSSDGQKLIKLAKEKDLILTVFQSRRWDADFLELKAVLKANALGEILHFESHYDRFRPQINSSRWREQNLPGSGILYDLGAHLIDQTLQLFGQPDAFTADVQTQRPGGQADDYFHLVFKYKRMRAILHSSCVVKEPGPRFAVHGTEGSFVRFGMDPQEEALRQGKIPDDSSFWGYRQFYAKLGEALNLKAAGKPFQLPVLPEESLAVIELIERCRQKKSF